MRTHDYADGDLALTGHWTAPEGEPRGAVLILPTIAGPNEPMFRRAAMLAELGYVAFVADYYGETHATPEGFFAAGNALRADMARFRGRCRAALEQLDSLSGLGREKTAAIGYCMGGQGVLELAREGADLTCVVSFHGILSTEGPAEQGGVKARMLVCHGHEDPLVPPEQVTAFQREMDDAGADWHLHIYSGVRHGFTDPASDTRGMAAIGYDASADRHSWAAMRLFLEECFG